VVGLRSAQRRFASALALLGVNLTLQIADGDVVLGEWQSIILAELDGPRSVTSAAGHGVAQD
jgi:thiamine phosphate synthase YjbQ (UPF0047 family)